MGLARRSAARRRECGEPRARSLRCRSRTGISKEATLRPSAQPSGDHRAMTAASKTTQARTRTAALIVLSIAIVTTPPILWGIEMNANTQPLNTSEVVGVWRSAENGGIVLLSEDGTAVIRHVIVRERVFVT